MAYFPLVRSYFERCSISKMKRLDVSTSKCQLYLPNKVVADKASQLPPFFSMNKQEECITRDHVRPSAASFNHHEIYQMNFEWNSLLIRFHITLRELKSQIIIIFFFCKIFLLIYHIINLSIFWNMYICIYAFNLFSF